MDNKESADITLNVLTSIRDEITALREDINKQFERIEKDISQRRDDIRHIVTRFDRDYVILVSDPESVKQRLQVCEQHLGIKN